MREEIKKQLILFLLRLNKDLFNVALVTYLILYLMESAKQGIVSNYLNLNIILYIIVASGIIMIFFDKNGKNKIEQENKITKKDYLWMTGISFAGAIIIFLKIKATLGWLGLVVGILSGMLIFLLSVLLIKGEDNEEAEKKVDNKKEFTGERDVKKRKIRKLIS